MAAASAMHCILARLHDTGTSTHHIEEFVALAATEAATRMWVNQVAWASALCSATDGVVGASFGGRGRTFRSAGIFLLRLHHHCWALLFFALCRSTGVGGGRRWAWRAVRGTMSVRECVCLCNSFLGCPPLVGFRSFTIFSSLLLLLSQLIRAVKPSMVASIVCYR